MAPAAQRGRRGRPHDPAAEVSAALTDDRNRRPTGPLSFRERLRRQPIGPSLWAGILILAFYAAVAVSALVEFHHSLNRLPYHPMWVAPPPIAPAVGPSLVHPFGVLPGLGVDLFQALWEATPWDLGIVFGILAIEATLGWTLGALAGMHEGGLVDSVVVFVGDTVGAIPSFFLAIAVFAGIATVHPNANLGLGLFVVLFGAIVWPATARTTRERARWVARQPFLEAARASGASRPYLYVRHVLPNSVSPVFAQIPIDLAPIFFVLTVFPWFWYCAGPFHGNTSGLTQPYLSPGLPPYSPLPGPLFPEWGSILAMGTCEGIPLVAGNVYWWMFLFPMAAIVLLGIGLALVCDGIDKRLAAAYA